MISLFAIRIQTYDVLGATAGVTVQAARINPKKSLQINIDHVLDFIAFPHKFANPNQIFVTTEKYYRFFINDYYPNSHPTHLPAPEAKFRGATSKRI